MLKTFFLKGKTLLIIHTFWIVIIYSLESRASMRSSRRLRNKPRPSKINDIPVSVYTKPPHLSPNYDTIEQADVEAASKLSDYAFATMDQTAQHQKLLLENEIAYENLKTATLIEQSQRAIDHENDINEIAVKKRKADIADELKLESAKCKLKLNNKFIEIET